MSTAADIIELKELIELINEKLGFEGVGLQIADGGSQSKLTKGVEVLRAIAIGIDA